MKVPILPIHQSKEQIDLLQEYAKKIKGVIVEIGTLEGGTASRMREVSNAKIFTIDNYSARADLTPKVVKENLKGLNIKAIVGDSNTLKWKIPIDLLFVDGGHDYEVVKKDIEMWLPRVKKGGYILFDDYESWVGPTQAVNEALEEGLLTKITQSSAMLVTQC